MLIKILPIFFLLFSCSKNHLYVQVESIGDDYLASVRVGTPDYRQENRPFGQRINILWNFSKYQYYQGLTLNLTVRFWDNSEETVVSKINKRFGSSSFFFKNPFREKQKRILTYHIQIKNAAGEIIERWNHHFWTELIDIDLDNNTISQK